MYTHIHICRGVGWGGFAWSRSPSAPGRRPSPPRPGRYIYIYIYIWRCIYIYIYILCVRYKYSIRIRIRIRVRVRIRVRIRVCIRIIIIIIIISSSRKTLTALSWPFRCLSVGLLVCLFACWCCSVSSLLPVLYFVISCFPCIRHPLIVGRQRSITLSAS